MAAIAATFAASASASAGSNNAEDSVLSDAAIIPWKGDLDGILKRGFIRILTAYNPLFFSYNGIDQNGLLVEGARSFEKRLNKNFGKRGRPISVVLIPVPRDKILPFLIEGRGDIAAANLTITPARSQLVDFSKPMLTNVKELIVSGPGKKNIKTLSDLSKTGVHIRESSSYYEHLVKLNNKRTKNGKTPIPIHKVDENLEDYDLLDMVNVGLIPAIIVDSHKAQLWQKVFKNITVHEKLSVSDGGKIAVAIRKESPKLLQIVNKFAGEFKKGTLMGNILYNRYLGSTNWMKNSWSAESRKKYRAAVGYIREYSDRFNFDWLMIAAQGYQESTLDQSKRSHVGAVGVMQVMPSTASDRNVNIPDIHKIEQNIHAGVKYLRFLRSRYFASDDIDTRNKILLSFAAYNAGPRKTSKARRKAKAMGLNPNKWFGNVEIAAAKTISREPVIYVRNIFKYYVTYKRLEEIQNNRNAATTK